MIKYKYTAGLLLTPTVSKASCNIFLTRIATASSIVLTHYTLDCFQVTDYLAVESLQVVP